MKKLLSIVLCATAVSAFAGSTEVELGTVGVTAITSSLSNTIVAVSYDDLAGGSGMIVSNFVKTTNLTAGDQLAIFNNGTGTEGIYDTWVLRKNGNDVLYWERNEKTYMVGTNGQLKVGTGTPASSITNAVGTGIWLVRKDPSKPFYIYGKPVSDPVSHISANTWTLVGNPTQELVEIGTNKVVGASYLDELVVPAEDGTLCRYQFKEGKGWRTTGSEGQWVDNAPPKLDAGLGCWIWTQKNASITW